jgi:hypothetical protein
MFVYVIARETVTTSILICKHSWPVFGALYWLLGLGNVEEQNWPMFLQTLRLSQGD